MTSAALPLRRDIIPHLPIEIQVMIASCISAHDIWALLNVSRTWRSIWLREDIVRLLARRFMPGFIDYHAAESTSKGYSFDMPTRFLYEARSLYFHTMGKFRSAFAVPKLHSIELDVN